MEPSVDGVEQEPGFGSGENGGLPFLGDVLWASHGSCRIDGHNLPGHQEVEKHPDGGQMQLDRGFGHFDGQLLDVGGDDERLDLGQPDGSLLTPMAESRYSTGVDLARPAVADIGSKELDKPPGRLGASFIR